MPALRLLRAPREYLTALVVLWAIVAIQACSALTLGQSRALYAGAVAADLTTTSIGLRQGATEQNTILGKSNPIVVSAALSLALAGIAEVLAACGDRRGAATLYQVGASLHGGAAAFNGVQLAR